MNNEQQHQDYHVHELILKDFRGKTYNTRKITIKLYFYSYAQTLSFLCVLHDMPYMFKSTRNKRIKLTTS